MTTNYEKDAEEFLTRNGIKFRAELIGSDCPRFCEDAIKGKDMDKVSTFPRKSHSHGKHYRCTFYRVDMNTGNQTVEILGRPTLTVDFWNSYADEEFNAWKTRKADNIQNGYWDKFKGQQFKPVRVPTPYDVLTSIEKNDLDTFENWCADCGYDTDSRRALETYEAVRKEFEKVRKFFTAEELQQALEIQ